MKKETPISIDFKFVLGNKTLPKLLAVKRYSITLSLIIQESVWNTLVTLINAKRNYLARHQGVNETELIF